MTITSPGVTRVSTGQVGVDHILSGGLPAGRSTLVSGTSGSGKTVFALQFLAKGIANDGEGAVFVTFEEPPEALRQHGESLGYDIREFEREGRWAFVDATFNPTVEEEFVGRFDLSGLITRIEHAVATVGATRISIDSVGVAFTRFPDPPVVRRELLRLVNSLRSLGVTAVITGEREDEYGAIGRFGVEEFVCDNAIVLRNALEEETRRRTIEVLKMRGTQHLTGEFPFTILPDEGFVAITLVGTDLTAESTTDRIVSGLPELDAMCGGGMFRDSVTLVSGPTGTGKTLLVTEFASGGAEIGERSLIFSFEESRAQLVRNAEGWGKDYVASRRRAPSGSRPPTRRSVRSRTTCGHQEHHRGVRAHAGGDRQPQRPGADRAGAQLPRVPDQPHGLPQAPSDRRAAHLDLPLAARRRVHHGRPHLDAHRHDHAAALRRDRRRDQPRLHGPQAAWVDPRQVDPRVPDQDQGMHIGDPFQNVTGILAGHPRESRMVSTRLNGLDSLFEEQR